MKKLDTNDLNLYEVGFCRSDLILFCRMIHLCHGRLIDQEPPGKVDIYLQSYLVLDKPAKKKGEKIRQIMQPNNW